MLVDKTHYRTVWMNPDGATVGIIDQRRLPFSFETVSLASTEDACVAIKEMLVRGAGCIGAVAAHGMFLAAQECAAASESAPEFDALFREKGEQLCSTRPTAMNLAWAVERQIAEILKCELIPQKVGKSREVAVLIADEDAEWCASIGQHGLSIIEQIFEKKGGEAPVNVLTHCNAGWLAFVDHGSATAPIYAAHDAGIPVHVWVDETRPRNQGARLTAWELDQHGVPHTVIVDNVGGHLMQHGMVDMVITGTDRTTYTGDVANKIGTYLKALAAHDNAVPFYVALPSSTFDWVTRDGVAEIPIEQRGGEEVGIMSGAPVGAAPVGAAPVGAAPVDAAAVDAAAVEEKALPEVEISLVAGSSPIANYAFDVTPARLISGLITERGICEANEEGIRALFPEKFSES